ncbi:MAG: helix-turn-helix domain-containing protein [Enterococcus sp.]|nr:helix-turn-helix domain-containing protein [Enterococcus sp.]
MDKNKRSSIKYHINELRNYRIITSQEMRLLEEITFLDGNKGCFASNAHLARHIGVEVVTLKKYIANLKRKGLIEVTIKNYSYRTIRVFYNVMESLVKKAQEAKEQLKKCVKKVKKCIEPAQEQEQKEKTNTNKETIESKTHLKLRRHESKVVKDWDKEKLEAAIEYFNDHDAKHFNYLKKAYKNGWGLSSNKASNKANKFNEMDNRDDWDWDDIERLEQERINKKLAETPLE